MKQLKLFVLTGLIALSPITLAESKKPIKNLNNRSGLTYAVVSEEGKQCKVDVANRIHFLPPFLQASSSGKQRVLSKEQKQLISKIPFCDKETEALLATKMPKAMFFKDEFAIDESRQVAVLGALVGTLVYISATLTGVYAILRSFSCAPVVKEGSRNRARMRKLMEEKGEETSSDNEVFNVAYDNFACVLDYGKADVNNLVIKKVVEFF